MNRCEVQMRHSAENGSPGYWQVFFAQVQVVDAQGFEILEFVDSQEARYWSYFAINRHFLR